MQKIGIFLAGLGIMVYLCTLSSIELYYLWSDAAAYKEFLGIK